MQVGIIKTVGGRHTSETMAVACADRLVRIDAELSASRALAAVKLQVALSDVLTRRFDEVRAEVQAELADDAHSHFSKDALHDPGTRLDETLSEVLDCGLGTPWAELFIDGDTQIRMRNVIGQFLVDVAHEERLYFGDDNPDHQVARQYREQPTGIAIIDVTG